MGQPSVATVETSQEMSTVACVQDNLVKNSFADHVVKVVKLGSTVCDKSALVDTGSPISFINVSVFKEICGCRDVQLKSVVKNYKSLDGHIINIFGIWSTNIIFKDNWLLANIDFHVVKLESVAADVIIGRDFLANYEIDISVRSREEKIKIELFSEIAFVDNSVETTNGFN